MADGFIESRIIKNHLLAIRLLHLGHDIVGFDESVVARVIIGVVVKTAFAKFGREIDD